MHSPFPGMDPFLERRWSNFHAAFGGYAMGILNPLLPSDLVAEVETDLYIHELSADERQVGVRRKIAEGDATVNVAADPDDHGGGAMPGAMLATKPTGLGRLPGVIEERHRKIVIRSTDGEEVVTVIELLSPTNKVRHRDAYLLKRAALLESPAHLVEIDLLRGGRRMPIDGCPDSDYLVTVSVAERRPTVDLFTFSLRDRLPVPPIPLRDGEAVPFDLRLVMDRVFEASAYEKRIYHYVPDPPLELDDARWAADILEEAGLSLPDGFPSATAE